MYHLNIQMSDLFLRLWTGILTEDKGKRHVTQVLTKKVGAEIELKTSWKWTNSASHYIDIKAFLNFKMSYFTVSRLLLICLDTS